MVVQGSQTHKKYSVYKLELMGLSWAAKIQPLLTWEPISGRILNRQEDSLDSIKNPRVLILLEDLLMTEFVVKYIPVAKNGIAAYMSRFVSNETDAPDYPRLVRKLKLDQGEIRIIRDAGIVDFELLWLAEKGNTDDQYVRLIKAGENKEGVSKIVPGHPLPEYGSEKAASLCRL